MASPLLAVPPLLVASPLLMAAMSHRARTGRTGLDGGQTPSLMAVGLGWTRRAASGSQWRCPRHSRRRKSGVGQRFPGRSCDVSPKIGADVSRKIGATSPTTVTTVAPRRGQGRRSGPQPNPIWASEQPASRMSKGECATQPDNRTARQPDLPLTTMEARK